MLRAKSLLQRWPVVAAAAAAAVLGCASLPSPLAGWSGPTVRVSVELEGTAANRDKRERCIAQVREQGALVSSDAPLSIRLHLDNLGNELAISSAEGVLLREARPGWGMDELCNDALAQALRFVRPTARARRSSPTAAAPPSWSPPAETPSGPPAETPRETPASQAPGAGASGVPWPLPTAPPAGSPSAALLGAPPPPVTASPPLLEPWPIPTPPPASSPRPPGARLVVTATPPGATITVDDLEIGRAPVTRSRLAPGDHIVAATWPNGRWISSVERVRRRTDRKVTLRMIE